MRTTIPSKISDLTLFILDMLELEKMYVEKIKTVNDAKWELYYEKRLTEVITLREQAEWQGAKQTCSEQETKEGSKQ